MNQLRITRVLHTVRYMHASLSFGRLQIHFYPFNWCTSKGMPPIDLGPIAIDW